MSSTTCIYRHRFNGITEFTKKKKYFKYKGYFFLTNEYKYLLFLPATHNKLFTRFGSRRLLSTGSDSFKYTIQIFIKLKCGLVSINLSHITIKYLRRDEMGKTHLGPFFTNKMLRLCVLKIN